jgi:hypothetical protein
MMLPDNRNGATDNGAESESIKAGGLASSMLQPTLDSSLRFEDRLAAFEAGRQQGKAERVDIEIEDQVRARIHDRAREALGLAGLSARHGAAFSAMVSESGEHE